MLKTSRTSNRNYDDYMPGAVVLQKLFFDKKYLIKDAKVKKGYFLRRVRTFLPLLSLSCQIGMSIKVMNYF